MKTLTCATLVMLSLGLIHANADSLPVDQLPPTIVQSVKNRFPKATMTKADHDADDVLTEYEVTLKDNGTKVEVKLTREGKITRIETDIAVKDLPKAVVATLDKMYPKATLKSAESVAHVTDKKESIAYYEVHVVTAEQKHFEVEVTPAGTVQDIDDKND